MDIPGVNDGFREAVDNLITSIDLESRGCQLVSPGRSMSSESDHLNVLNKLRTLLETPAANTPGSAILTDSGKYLQYKDVVSAGIPELPLKDDKGKLDYNQPFFPEPYKGKDVTPAGSNTADKPRTPLKSGDRETVLKHAEAVIEYQRERINALEEAISKFNTSINKTNDLYKQELQRLGDENLSLRSELQKAVTEYEVLSKRYSLDLSEADATKRKVNVINYDLQQKDNEIAKLKERLEHFPKENHQLKEKNILLSNEVDRLNREIKGLNLIEFRKPPKATVAEIASNAKACSAQQDKLKASSKCIANLENDLESYKRLTESQSMEIRRLNYKLEKMKSSTRPIDYVGVAQKQMLQIRSIFTQLAKQSKETRKESNDNPVDEEVKNRSLYAAYSLKASVEFREMYDKLLEVVNQNLSKSKGEDGFYSMVVNYRCDPLEEEMRLHIDESVLTLNRLGEEENSSDIRITLNSVLNVMKVDENHEFCFRTSDSSVHVITANNREQFCRLYYALQYAGFITENVRFSIFSKVDYTWIPESFTWPSFTAVVSASECNYNGEAPVDYNDVKRLMEEVYIISDPVDRLITIENNTNSLVITGPRLSSTPFIVHCESVFAVRLCNHKLDECEGFEPIEPPVATLGNGAPTANYFSSSKHTFSFILPSNRVLFVNAVDADNEKRFLNIVRKGTYKVPGVKMPSMKTEVQRVETLQLTAKPAAEPEIIPANLSIELKSNSSIAPPSEPEVTKIYEFVGDALLLYMKEQDPIKILSTTGRFKVNEQKHEVAILSGDTETYVLNFPSLDSLREFVKHLESHGFDTDANVEKHKQLCIVSAGCLELYKDSDGEPIITFRKEDTKVTITEAQREIQISQVNGKMIKMTLDCTSPGEFQRWKFALSFAGFIKSSMKAKPGDALNKFMFPIKIFDNDPTEERRAFQVEANRICMYVNPTTKDPFLIFEKPTTFLEVYDSERRLRVYVNRNSRMEERFDFVLAMLTDYETLKSSLKAHLYRLETPKKPKTCKYHFVLSKPGIITVHRTKHDVKPQLTLDRKSYTANVSHMRIQFTSKLDATSSITMAFEKDFNFRRWLMALKVAGFLPLTSDRVPILYLPTIFYGHHCVEIPTLLKGHLK